MIMMSSGGSKSILARLYCQLVVTLLLALLIEEPSSRLVNGQLEAVGAVLSVVPVTSILATAGLVGVKLAALSRLLNILGYDRAYLAQNLGTGTAATPIGLQTRYAYMFPYVPGLNISVKGEDSIGLPKGAGVKLSEDGTKMVATGESGQSDVGMGPGVLVSSGPPRRKTYPSMGLPADYESQQKPFRGAEALKSIFSKAGLQVHIPTVEQQQQLQQKFELPAQASKQAIVIELPPESSTKSAAADKQQQQPIAIGKGSSSRHSSTASTPFSSLPDPVMSSAHQQQRAAPLQAPQPGSQKATPTKLGDNQRKQPSKSGQKQHNGRPAGASFGMPVSNINTLKKRRRRRQVRLFGLSSQNAQQQQQPEQL